MKTSVVLVVDDEPINFDVIEALLGACNYELHYAASGKEAFNFLSSIQPDLILLDVAMPEMDGIAVCQQVKGVPQWRSIPIVIVTAMTDKQLLARCLEAGADDFINKPVNRLELNARIRSMLRISQQYQKLSAFNTYLEATIRERTEQLRNTIARDSLTELPSRIYFLEHLATCLAGQDSALAVIVLDCDRFHLVNGSLGYLFGDKLLIAIANRLRQLIRDSDIIARLAEDKFCLLIDPLPDATMQAAKPLLQKIQDSFERPFIVEGCEVSITTSMGIAISQWGIQTADALLQAADTAMYRAKQKGKGSIEIFKPQMSLDMHKRLTLETDLQRALKNQEFTLFYQPIIDLKSENLVGFEALMRWQHPKKGIVSPNLFIPAMEATGLIIPVGFWVLQQACQQLQTWHQQGWTELTMSVNLSTRQFSTPNFLADIDRVLAETKVNPACLKLEITESVIMESADRAIALTEALRSRKIQISIDDFGTGYSSLAYLNRFPVSTLKIDRFFINQFNSEEDRYPIVNTIVTLGQQLGLSIVAEGIETFQQVSWLKSLSCDFGQGYFFSRPLPAHEIGLR